jgi:hypothetical protein
MMLLRAQSCAGGALLLAEISREFARTLWLAGHGFS